MQADVYGALLVDAASLSKDIDMTAEGFGVLLDTHAVGGEYILEPDWSCGATASLPRCAAAGWPLSKQTPVAV